ncbi:ribonuclease H-like domain-containing protein [Neobacillus sp. SM06]|uniref:ribonuclease H-like domain-containing protein n=1 Tax=Neobacillus sp. SM06 TaxID=3422492 RepID=UPI003D2D35F9
MSLKNKLARLKPHLSANPVAKEDEKVKTNQTSMAGQIPYQDHWEKENVYPFFFDNNYCLVRETTYPLDQQHGNYCFRDFLKAVEMWNAHSIEHPLSAKEYLPEELFFFDTETTGLGGGVGNTIFLLGYASVSGDQLILRQHILANPGAEVPLYQSFLESINYKTLVTYNGKSFDWPQVKTRHTLVRDHVPKLPQFGHFDLYHAARRLWKHKLERLKLSVVEKEILGVERVDDVPGFLAPMIYFDFVESRQPDGMLGILKHNEIDILSLVTLYAHLTFQIFGYDTKQTRRETFEVGRWFAHLGDSSEAEKVFNKLSDGTDWSSQRAKFELAMQHKKQQKWDLALELFKELASEMDGEDVAEACIEAAKILEHRYRNYSLALDYSLKAGELLKKMAYRDRKKGLKFQKALQTRISRLENKRKKFPG